MKGSITVTQDMVAAARQAALQRNADTPEQMARDFTDALVRIEASGIFNPNLQSLRSKDDRVKAVFRLDDGLIVVRFD